MAFLPRKSRFILTLVIALFALVITIPVNAQTTLTGQMSLRPMTNDDITNHKLPATTQKSGGLSTVGIGQPVYMDALVAVTTPAANIASVTWAITAKPTGATAAIVDSPFAATVPPYEPGDREAFTVAARKMFKPDVEGQYTITATITAGNGEKLVETVDITAATYVGIKSCSGCHSSTFAPNKAPAWAKTAHASIFKQGVNGVASDHYAQSCISCHTVGYDTNTDAVNGGFDDVMAKVKWTFPTSMKEGTFEALPEELRNVGNIQCENCHGPGSQHARNMSKKTISVSLESGACGQCHNAGTHHVKTAEWLNSGHAATVRSAAGAGHEGCVGCHTGAGFVDRAKNAATPRTSYSAIGCQTCHESHGQTAPDATAHLVRTAMAVTLKDGTEVVGAGAGKLCMNCHQSRQNAAEYVATAAATARFGPHHSPQADMVMGANAFTYGITIPSSAHGDVVEDTCVTCHMQTVAATDPALKTVGGHTFKMRSAAVEGAEPVEMVAACQKCHGPDVTTFNFPLFDYDGDGIIDGVQTEVQHLLDKLSEQLPPVGQVKSALTIDSTWTRAQLEAAYNWQFVNNDGSRGVHNTAYTVGLLKTTLTKLGDQKK
ncbi:MAG: hypothetical protein HY820_43295 [Acidobacteria bacterium]|nr:hypothetical protein [Acidobacteriota bacterium]